jgi:predicted flap endonuclease-1-like 5' DNA nuclease
MHKTARNLTALGVGLSISAVVGWLFLRGSRRDIEKKFVTIRSKSHAPGPDEMPKIVLPLDSVDDRPAPMPDSREDDLTQIRDIGPRFAEALRTIGITRYTQLAEQTPEALAEHLAPYVNIRPDRIRSNDWIGQAARLAGR